MWFYMPHTSRNQLLNSDDIAYLEVREKVDDDAGRWQLVVHFSSGPTKDVLAWNFSTEAKARAAYDEGCAMLTAPTIQEGPV